jgi:hypothetical protein
MSKSAIGIFQVDMRAALAQLSPHELVLLVRYIADGETQKAIGLALCRPQQTVSHNLRKAAAKLAGAGMPVPMPGRGRRKGSVRYVDPSALNRLQTSGDRVGGGKAKWIDAKKIDRGDG